MKQISREPPPPEGLPPTAVDRESVKRKGPRLGVLGKLLLTMVVLVIGVFAAEVVLRVAWAAPEGSWSGARAVEILTDAGLFMREGTIEEKVGVGAGAVAQKGGPRGGQRGKRPSVERFLHPYFGWDVESPLTDYEIHRREQMARDRVRYLDILVLGGSVAAGFGGSGKEALIQSFQADPRFRGRQVRVYNYAIAAFKQPQQLMRLSYLLTLGFAPDIVINIDGFNEVAIGKQNGSNSFHPLHPSEGQWTRWLESAGSGNASVEAFDALAELRWLQLSSERQIKSCVAWNLHRSALATGIASWWLGRTRERGLVAHRRWQQSKQEQDLSEDLRRGPDYRRGAGMMELIVDGWANASLSLHGICAARETLYVHVLQPALHDEGSKPLTKEELESSKCSAAWLHGVQLGYPMLRAAGQQLRQKGVCFLDASRIFAEHTGTLYFDVCHFVGEGHEILARAIADQALRELPADWAKSKPALEQAFLSRR